ncbi:MAG: YdcF family protein [Acidobacteriota bacterium]|nr:YdcF family protein [Acidobacteriota bacterium]
MGEDGLVPGWFEQIGEQEYEALLYPIWSFLCDVQTPVSSDVIFVFGSLGVDVPRRAAELYADGWAPRILISGRLGPMTEPVFEKPEALVFKDELLRLGVPDSAVTTEVAASNTLENVTLGMTALSEVGIAPGSALLVAKAFAIRRCLATFAKHYPEVAVRGCPPRGTLVEHRDRARAAFASRLVAELRRLDDYGVAGDIVVQRIPKQVRAAAQRVQRLLDDP